MQLCSNFLNMRAMAPAESNGRLSDWEALYNLASSQAGYFHLDQALKLGFGRPLLSYHVQVGNLRRERRGVYRLVQFPSSESEELVVHWLWSKREGVFGHETALALHQLSDVMPRHVHLTVPPAWARRRVKVPTALRLHYSEIPASERTKRGAIPVTTPFRTIRDCLESSVSPELVTQALEQAARRGEILKREDSELRRLQRSARART